MGNLKKRLEYILKHNLVIQGLYKFGMSSLFQLAGCFIQTDPRLILFNSFGGRKFNDSPKVLFDAMVNDPRFGDFRFVWAFEEPQKFTIPGAKSIKIDSWDYFKTALRAKVWISSVNIERGLHFKKKETIYINTWHGAGTKKIGNACNGRKDYDFSAVNMMLVQSEFEREIFERDFLCRPDAIRTGNYVMLFRMHTFTTKFEMVYDEFARDVSTYEDLNHILAVTDVLITDYSTIVYDAAIAGIPFICFGFDYDIYREERGFYFDLDAVYPGGVFKTEDEVIRRVTEVAQGKDRDQFDAFRRRYIEAGGSATQSVIEELSADLA